MNDSVSGSGDTNNGGWRDSKMRNTTMPAIEELMPEHLKNRINTVKKVSFCLTEEQITYDNLWIPSIQEAGFDGYETNGNSYSGIFTNDDLRIKQIVGGANSSWWTRSTETYPSIFKSIGSSGGSGNYGSSASMGIALSFSVGHIPEKIQWRMLSDAIEDGTYRDKYHIGDEIPYTTTDGDTYHAVIAAFGGENGDVDADGNAIPVTFVTKELYGTTYQMNATNTNAGGWEVSAMRTSVMPALMAKLPEYVTKYIVVAKKYSYDKTTSADQITYDKLWIPNYKELGFTSSNQESGGSVYSGVYTDDTSRIKKFNGTASFYWTRTADSSITMFRGVFTSGGTGTGYANSSSGVLIGFCYGAPASSTTTVAPTATDVSKAYGVEWDYSQSSPQLTRKGLSASFTDPSPATSVSGSGSSPFDSIWPWAGMEVYNITPEGRRIKKGETGFSFTDYDVMVYIPEFWYTAQKDTTNSKWTWAISPTPIAGYEKHPGSGRFVSKYHTSGSASAVASKSGTTPLVSTTQTNFRTYSKNKGDNWYMLDIATWSALQMLYLVEYANFDSQTMLGKGWNTGSVGNVGGNDSATYHTVKLTGDHNMYHWIEDPFSNAMDFIDGFIGGPSDIYVGTNNSAFDGNTLTLTKAGNLKLPTSDIISNFGYDNVASWAFIPSESISGSNYNTYTCDNIVAVSLYPVCVGGSYYNLNNYGMFCMFNTGDASNFMGSRLIYLS